MFGETRCGDTSRDGAGRARRPDAQADLEESLSLDGRKWVHARSHLELGKLALKAGNKAAAVELRAAIPLAESDNDPLRPRSPSPVK